MPVIGILPLRSNFTLLDCSVKMNLGPLSLFPLPVGAESLSVEGAGETLQEERDLLPGSSVLSQQAPVA